MEKAAILRKLNPNVVAGKAENQSDECHETPKFLELTVLGPSGRGIEGMGWVKEEGLVKTIIKKMVSPQIPFLCPQARQLSFPTLAENWNFIVCRWKNVLGDIKHN